MKAINQIKAWVEEVKAQAKKKNEARKMMRVMNESHEALQAMEFDGEMYLCHRGVPIVNADQLMCSIPEALHDSREVYVDYVIKKGI